MQAVKKVNDEFVHVKNKVNPKGEKGEDLTGTAGPLLSKYRVEPFLYKGRVERIVRELDLSD